MGDFLDDDDIDEYERWRTTEPKWTKQQFDSSNSNVIKYWRNLQPRYPNLSRLAIDILTYLLAVVSVSACSVSLEIYSPLGVAKLGHNCLLPSSVYAPG
jgi:hypothetical protein